MMSNYSKTMELVNAANNSAGASQEQYEKTLESLETKLSKLRNAWDEFVMGLSNNEVIKTAVDVLTSLLQTINKIISSLSGGNGLIKSVLSIGTAIGGLKLGKSIISSLIGNMIDTKDGGIFSKAFGTTTSQKKAGLQAGKSFLSGLSDAIKNKSLPKTDYIISDFSKNLTTVFKSKEWSFDFSNAKPEGLTQFKQNITNSLSQGDEASKALSAQFSSLWDTKKYNEAITALEKAGIQIKLTGEEAQQMGISVSKTDKDFRTMAIAAGVAASALMGLATILDNNGKEKAANIVRGIATALMGLIPVITMVQTAMIAGAESVSVAIKNIPIIGWIAAIISAVISLIQIFSQFAPETQAKKTERLAEQTQKAAEAAQAAQQTYSNLVESFDKYGEAVDKINDLTVGTTEWKNALLDVNNQVLELLDKYPQLASYLTSENGVLGISEEGIQKATDIAQEQARRAQALSVTSQYAETTNQRRIAQEAYQQNFWSYDQYTGDVITNPEAAKAFSNYLKENPDMTAEDFRTLAGGAGEELSKLADITGLTVNQMADLVDITRSYNKDMVAYGLQEENYRNALGVLAGDVSSNKRWNMVTQMFNLDETTSEIDAARDKLDTTISKMARDLKDQGYTSIMDLTGSDATYRQVYEAVTGQSSESVDIDSIKDYVAQFQVLNGQVKEAIPILNKLTSMKNQGLADEIAGRIAGGTGLTRAQAEKPLTKADLQEMASQMGYANDDEMAKAFGFDDWTALFNQWSQDAASIASQFEEKEATAANVIGQNQVEKASSLMGDKDFQTYSNYLEQLATLYAKAGVNGAQAVDLFQSSLEALISNNPQYEKEIKDIIGMTDLSDYDSVEAAISDIKELIPGVGDELNNFETALIQLGKATKKVNLKTTMSDLTSMLDLADEISSRSRSEGITQNELEQIVSSGAADYSDFMFTGQEFVPVTSTMDDLAEAVRANTQAAIENTLALLKQAISEGEYVEEMFNQEESWKGISDEQKNRILSGEASATLDANVIRDVLQLDKSASTEEVMSKYRAYMPDYLNLADNRSQAENYQSYMDQAAAWNTDAQNLLLQGNTDVLDDIVNARELSGTIEKLTDDYKANTENGEANSDMMKTQGVRYTENEKKIKKLCEGIEDVKDAFDKGTEALANGETPADDYWQALSKIESKGRQVFGENFTQDFIQQNADLISQLTEGGEAGEQAFISLQQKISEATQKAVEDLTYFDTNLQQVRSALDGLDGVKAEFKVNGTADVSQLVQQLILAGNTAAEAARIVESLTGSTVTYTVDWQWVTLPTSLAMSSTYAGLEKAGASGGFTSVKIPKVIQAVGTKNNYSGSGYSGSSSGGGGGGGSSSKDTIWENPYDKLYNLTEQINEALRQREKLEREYDRVLERRGSTFKELRANYNAQVKSLEEEIKLQEKLRAGRKGQLDAISNEKYTDSEGNRKTFAQTGATKYARYDQSLNRIIIDWDAIDMITDDDLGSAVEAYISRLEELQDQFETTDETIEDMKDTLDELRKSQMSDYLDFEQSVYDALVNAQQKLIDEYQSLSDSIADSNSKILENLQESIDLERQIRDNTKTEEDINEKEARLAFLRRDTSNANALEIKKLEEELSDARENYSDSLVDQQLERLTQQNQDAQEAREKQIELMQAQLDYASENGEFWNRAYELINEGFAADGSLNQAAQLWELLKADEGWNGLSKFGQLNWQEEISKAIIAASQGYANWNMYKAEQVDKSLVLPDGTLLTYDGKQWKDSNGNVYNGIDFDSNKNQFTYGSIDYATPPTPGGGSTGSSGEAEKKEISVGSTFNATGAPIYPYPGGSAQRQYFANDPYYVAIGESGDYWLARWHGASSGSTGWFKKTDVKAYKTGGLADFTGPAWLDGTKSHPELVLNAKDTQNFLILRDILSSAVKNAGTSNNGGDNYYDINISVDEIASDYDVDQLARRVKEQIVEDSIYRNVNTISFIR